MDKCGSYIFCLDAFRSGGSMEATSVVHNFFGTLMEQVWFDYLCCGSLNTKCQRFGVEEDYNVLVMDFLGPSLEDQLNFCCRKLSLACRLDGMHTPTV